MAVDGGTAVVGVPGADFFEGLGLVYERSSAAEDWRETSSLLDASVGLRPVTGGQVDCSDGSVNDWSCEDVDLVSFLPVQAVGGARGIMVNDVWGWTDSLTGTEYAIVGRSDATTFIDIGDPANPVYLGYLPLTATATINIWRDIKVYRNHAFIVADGAGEHGMQVFDLTQLRSVANPPVEFAETATVAHANKSAAALYTLSVAYANAGRISDAQIVARWALSLAHADEDEALSERIRDHARVLRAASKPPQLRPASIAPRGGSGPGRGWPRPR